MMDDNRFAILGLLAACATVAAVALHHGLGVRQTAVWVGIAAGAMLLFELCRHVAQRALPQADPITQVNFAAFLCVATATFALAVLGAVHHNGAELGFGLAVAVPNGALGYSMLRRNRS
jgi:hypothetical protein